MLILVGFFVSALISYFGIRKTIFISNRKNLVDMPNESRKIHLTPVPNLGGIAIFSSIIFTYSLLAGNTGHLSALPYIICAFTIIFSTGLTDDLIAISPSKKILGQLIAAVLMSLDAGTRIQNLHGFLFIEQLNFPTSLFISVMFYLLLMNAFNLIDGIDWLAGSISFVCLSALTAIFIYLGDAQMALFTAISMGAIAGFLLLNKTPAKIFLGDSGSLFLGAAIALCCIIMANKLVSVDQVTGSRIKLLSIIFSIISIPLTDTIRITILRLAKGQSPFMADRNHLHHRFIDFGLSHIQTSLLFSGYTLLLLFISLLFPLADTLLLGIFIVATSLFTLLIEQKHRRKLNPSIEIVWRKEAFVNPQIEHQIASGKISVFDRKTTSNISLTEELADIDI